MANRAIIYRLYPTASQKLLLTKTFGCCRFVYNRLLSVQQERYKNGEKHLSRTHANNFCNRLHTATFRGHQGRVLRPDRAILSGQS